MQMEHVKAHGTKKEKKHMSQFERFVTEGNEKADELAKAGAMLDEGFVWQIQEQKLCSKKERRCMQPYSMRPASTAQRKNGRTVKSSNRSQKKSGLSWIRRVRKRSIEQSGVRKQTSIDV